MRKMKSRVISLLTMTAIIATGTVPQVFAEALDDSTSAVISEAVNNEKKTENDMKTPRLIQFNYFSADFAA